MSVSACLERGKIILAEEFDSYLGSFNVALTLSPVDDAGHQHEMRLRCRDRRRELDFRLCEAILALMTDGRISALQRCVACGRWMHARQESQRFCGKACRQKAWQTVSEVREKRRADRRKRYWEEQERNRRLW
jgi:hypothetical protein